MPGVIETIGLLASILQLAGYLRNLFTRICEMTSNSRVIKLCRRFVSYLESVEKLCGDPSLKETSVMRTITEGLKLELEMAKALVSRFLDKNCVSRRVRARKFLKDLEQSRAAIRKFIKLILMANRETHVPSDIAQDGHAHSGNEDSSYTISLSVSLDIQVTANRIGSSSEVYRHEVLARSLQQRSNRLHIGSPSRSNRLHIGSPSRSNRLDIGFPSRSNQSPTDARDSSEVLEDEALVRAVQEGLDIGSPPWGRSQVDDDAVYVLDDLN